MIEEQGKRFHQGVMVIEERCRGRWDTHDGRLLLVFDARLLLRKITNENRIKELSWRWVQANRDNAAWHTEISSHCMCNRVVFLEMVKELCDFQVKYLNVF